MPPGFESPYPAALRQISATDWELLAPITYFGSKGDVITVPAGFQTDLASVPRPLQALFPVFGVYTNAVIVHDYLWRVLAPAGLISYRDADGILRQAMRTLGVGPVRRWVMWAAVRWGALTRKGGHRGWLRDAPAVLVISLLALPLALPAAVAALPALLLLALTG